MLQVTSYKLQVTRYMLQLTDYKFGCAHTSQARGGSKLHFTRYKLWVTCYKLRVKRYKLQVTWYKLRVTSLAVHAPAKLEAAASEHAAS